MIDFSVVMATYRRPAELRQAIGSALVQRHARIEVLVMDDCPDGSAESVVRGIGDDRVVYLRNPHPTGGRPAVVRNLAWPLARGRFVHFLDDDDLVPEGHYAAMRQAFAGSRAGVVFGRVEPFGDDAADVRYEQAYFADAAERAASTRRFGSRWALSATLLFQRAPLVCSAAVIRRECVAALGGFDERVRLVEDVEFYARAIRRFGAEFIDRTTLHRRIGPSLIHQPDIEDELVASYQRMHANYREQWGRADFLALKTFARTVLKVM